jgi:hypothetical protein
METNRLRFAIRRYETLMPVPEKHIFGSKLRRLRLWLNDDVCSVIEDYVNRPKFRERASWSLRALHPDADTEERQQLTALRRALQKCAASVTKLAKKKRIQSELIARFPPRSRATGDEIEISDGAPTSIITQREPVDELGLALAQIGANAKAAPELVIPAEYFFPQARLTVGQEATQGELIQSLNPELHSIGDFVVRCLFRRLELLIRTLDDVRGKIGGVVIAARGTNGEWEQVESFWAEIQSRFATLKTLLLCGTDNQMRDSCIVLSQVYAAFHPSPDVGWLGLSASDVQMVAPLQSRVTGFRNGELFDRVAVALTDLQHLYRDDSEPAAAKDAAIAAGGLVFDLRSQELYWDGGLISEKLILSPNSWEFMNLLASKARLRASVTENDLYGDEDISITAMSSAASRLRDLVPTSLRKLIVTGNERRSYRLDLDPEHIYIIS